MSGSIDVIRREIGQARDKLAFLHRDEDKAREQIAGLEATMSQYRAQLEATQAAIVQEETVVEALRHAEAVLRERLPVPSLPSAEPEIEDAEVVPDSEEERHERAQQHAVLQRAQELDLTEVSDIWFQRADLVAMLLVDHGPMRQRDMAPVIIDMLGLAVESGSSTISRIMPILVRQGRVRPTDHHGSEYRYTWEATPQERASARVGTDVDAYKGTTTRWPQDADQRPGGRIQIEPSAYETKR